MKNSSVPSHVRPICGAGVSMPSGPKFKNYEKGKNKSALQMLAFPSQRLLQSQGICFIPFAHLFASMRQDFRSPLMGIVESGICNAYSNKPLVCDLCAEQE
jgi:hypothetical protein